MKRNFNLTQKDFDALLGWLSVDREAAGRKYENIRDGLIRFFRFHGCDDPNDLADETINRVAAKVSGFDNSRNVKTTGYIYGFAANVYMEYTAEQKNQDITLLDEENLPPIETIESLAGLREAEFECLENCLAKLPAEENRLLISYYSKQGSERFAMRKTMADALNIKPNALYMRVHRIKVILKDCIENCVNKK